MEQEHRGWIVIPERPHIMIIGAGPAGSALATLVARRGWSVVLVDRATFPRPKACGEFLSPGALSALDRLGLPRPGPDAAVLDRWTLAADGQRATATLADVRGASLPRTDLDAALVDEARGAGVHVLEQSVYRRAGRDPGTGAGAGLVEVRTPAGTRRFHPQLLVGAGGLHCPVSRWLGGTRPGRAPGKISLTAHVSGIVGDSREGRLFVRGRLTVGLAPSDQEGRWWNATVVVPASWAGTLSARGARSFFLDCLAETRLGSSCLTMAETSPLASSGFDRPPRRCFVHRTVLVGDAAGYFDPFTGQGIYQALRSSELLAPFINLGLSGQTPWPAALSQYGIALSRERRRTRGLQRTIHGWLGSGRLRPALSAGLARAPTLFGAIMEATTDRSPLGAALRRRLGAASPAVGDVTLRTGAPTPL